MTRRRRGEEGAALVEAVVAIPFFLVVMGCIGFAGQTYSAKMGVMRSAREKVWAYASTNCGTRGDGSGGPGGLDTSGILSGSESNGNNGGANTSAAGTASGAPHSDVISKDMGSAAIDTSTDVKASGVLGAMTASPSSHRKVMCNEPPYDGDVAGAVKSSWHDMTGW